MKKCFKCDLEKPLSEFYKHKAMGDGYLNKCKECTKKDVSDRHKRLYSEDREWLEKERARGREKYRRLDYKDRYKGKRNGASRDKWRKNNEDKWNAQNKIAHNIRSGNVLRQGCSVCGAKAHAHHFDYSKSLAVIWYCPKHHGRIHRFMRYFKEKYGENFIPKVIKGTSDVE